MTRTSTLTPALLFLSTALSMLAYGVAWADPPAWTADQKSVHTFVAKDGRVLEVSTYKADLHVKVEAGWRGKQEPAQVLWEGACNDSRFGVPTLSGETLRISLGTCSRYDETGAVRTFEWTRLNPSRFSAAPKITHSSSYQRHFEAMSRLLALGKIREAEAVIGLVGTSPNGHTSGAEQVLPLFLQATNSESKRLVAAGRAAEAAGLVEHVLADSTLDRPCAEDLSAKMIFALGATKSGCTPVFYAPNTPQNRRIFVAFRAILNNQGRGKELRIHVGRPKECVKRSSRCGEAL